MVEWSLDNGEGFSLRWTERGGPAVTPPDPDQLGFAWSWKSSFLLG
jgi:hypothetical protein